MAGDKFSIKANSWYKTNGIQPQAATNPLNDLLIALTNGVGNLPGAKSSPLQLQQSAVFTPGATSFLNNQPAQGVKPKAYLNWVLFDEQFNFVQASSGSELVGSDNVFTSHIKSNLPISKNGYLYVYVSNATPNLDVYFDNLQVTHSRGAILEESHYYPFGLVQQGISSKSAGKLQNKDKTFQGQKFDDDLGVDWYSFKYRNHDAQIGRFIEIDPLAEDYVYNSTYAFSENHVTSHVELEGLEKISIQNINHASPSNHHTKDLSVIMLNREQVLTNSRSVNFGQNNVVPKGFTDAASWLQSSKTTKVSDMNFITSVSETVNTYNSAIVDGESGKLLKTTTTAVTTEVNFSVNDISAINVTTNTSIGYSKITGDDPKNNTLSISLNSSLISTPTSQTTAIPVDKSLSTNLSKLSPGLAPKVTEAVKENNKMYENNKKTIIKNTIH